MSDLHRSFPEPGVVVVLRDLVQPHLLVVHRVRVLGRVEHAALKRGVDVAGGKQLGHCAEPAQDCPAHAADADLQALEVRERLDLLAVPAAHLRASQTHRHVVDAVARVEFVEQLQAAALHHPGNVLARVQPTGNRCAERERRILADVEVGGGDAGLDRAVLDRVEHLQRRDDLAWAEQLDLELAIGQLADALGEGGDRRPGDRGLRKTRHPAPLDLRLGVHDRGRAENDPGCPRARGLRELPSLHFHLLWSTCSLALLPPAREHARASRTRAARGQVRPASAPPCRADRSPRRRDRPCPPCAVGSRCPC